MNECEWMNEFMTENEKEWKMTGITNKVCKNDRQSEWKKSVKKCQDELMTKYVRMNCRTNKKRMKVRMTEVKKTKD